MDVLPPPAKDDWAVLLCRPSDIEGQRDPISFYTALFQSPNGLVWDYFNKVSFGNVDLSGTRVFGWFTMAATNAELAARTGATRKITVEQCRGAAVEGLLRLGVSTNIDDYRGVITLTSVHTDMGSTGGKNIVLTFNHARGEVTMFGHEMLHVYGLPDSRLLNRDTGTDHPWQAVATSANNYGDCWDIMSSRSCAFTFASQRGPHGPELNTAFANQLGWLPPERITDLKQNKGQSSTSITLAPIGEPGKDHPLMLRITLGDNMFYVVEYRRPVRFDRAGPAAAIVIREYNGSATGVIRRSNDRIDWRLGETFTDNGNAISIRVDGLKDDVATIMVTH